MAKQRYDLTMSLLLLSLLLLDDPKRCRSLTCRHDKSVLLPRQFISFQKTNTLQHNIMTMVQTSQQHHYENIERISLSSSKRGESSPVPLKVIENRSHPKEYSSLRALAWNSPPLRRNPNNCFSRGFFVSQSFLLFIGSTWILPTDNVIAAMEDDIPGKRIEFATSAGRKNCTTISDPSKTIVTCYGDVSTDQIHVSSISSTENGISTSAIRNPARYSPPWTYLTETSNATKAWLSLYDTVMEIEPNVQIIQYTDTYLHVTVPTKPLLVGVVSSIIPDQDDVDDIEFVLRSDDHLVLYRSASRKSIFIYPLTQPVSDRNSHYDRLQR